jgi:hypothetical protein
MTEAEFLIWLKQFLDVNKEKRYLAYLPIVEKFESIRKESE